MILDLVGPYRGRCGICGGDDARHRMADTIVERVDAGEPAHEVADDYGFTVWQVLLLCALWAVAS